MEEYVYDMRDKLHGVLEKYVTEADRDSFSLKLEDTENWLYEDGEDQQKQVYIDKLAELKTLGQPICERFLEAEERPRAFEELGRQIQLFMKIVESYKAKDEQYEHLEELEVTRAEKQVSDAMAWMNSRMNQQNNQSLTLQPVVRVAEIRDKAKELHTAVNPVLSKAKPTVESPKEESASTNGPVNGHEEPQPAGDTATPSTDKKLPQMDID